jgi:hypothetical protein
MPLFTIETAHLVPFYRQRTYRAANPAKACEHAMADDDWDDAKPDYDCCRPDYVSGIWPGRDNAYQTTELPLPSQFEERTARQEQHFLVMLELLKRITSPDAATRRAIATAEAILADAPDP